MAQVEGSGTALILARSTMPSVRKLLPLRISQMPNRPITRRALDANRFLKCNLVVNGEMRPYISSMRNGVRGISWSEIRRTLLVEILVLLALLAAVVRYLEWSSDANQAEFMSATKPSASDPNRSGEFSTLIQALKGRAGCDRKA